MAKEHLTAVIGADYGPFSSAVNKMKGQVGGFANDMAKWGKRAAIGFGLMAAPLALVARTGMKFERQMSKVQAIINPTSKEFKTLRDEAKRLGSTTEKTATDVGGAIQMLGQAGLKTDQIMKTLTPVLDMATVTQLDMASATTMVTDTMAAYQIKAEEAARVTDMYAHVQSMTNTSAAQLAEGISNAGSAANKMGWSMETTGAALGFLANQSFKGGRGGTFLNSAITKLLKPTDDAAKIMKKYGVSLRDSSGEIKKLPDLLKDLETANLGSSASAEEMIELFGVRGVKAMDALLKAEVTLEGQTYKGSEALRALTKDTLAHGGAAAKAASIIRADTTGAFESLMSAVEGASIELFDKFAEPLKNFVNDTLVKTVRGIGSWIKANKELAPTFSSVFKDVGAISGEFILMGQALAGAFNITLGKSQEVNTGFLTAVTTFRQWVEEIAPKLPILIEEASTKVEELWTGVKNVATGLRDGYGYARDLAGGMDPVLKIVGVIADGWGVIWDNVKFVTEEVGTLAGKLTSMFLDSNVGSDMVTKMFGDAKQWITGGAKIAAAWVGGMTTYLKDEGLGLLTSGLGKIGKFMIGQSPPPEGPLSMIDQGGANIGKAWVDGLLGAMEEGKEPLMMSTKAMYDAMLGNPSEGGSGGEGGAGGGGSEGGEGGGFVERLAANTTALGETMNAWTELTNGFQSTFQQGIGQSVNALASGSGKMGSIWKDLTKNMAINWLKSMAMQNASTLASAIFGVTTNKAASKAKNAANASVAGSGATAFAATHMPAPAAKAVGVGMKSSVMGMSMITDSMGSLPLPGSGGVALAEGGLVTHRTKALIGEAGPELVVPLEKMGMMGMGQGVNITMNITTGVITRDVATDIAEALTDVVDNLGVELASSRAELAINVEDPIVA